MRRSGVLLTFLAAACLGAASTAASAQSRPQSFEAIHADLLRDCAEGRFSGIAHVRQNKRTLLHVRCGLADRAAKLPITDDTRFKLASVTKPLTAIAVLRLAQTKRIDLDEPVTRYLRSAPASWSDIKVRHLLQHTSGIADHIDRVERHAQTDPAGAAATVLRELALERTAPASRPGSKYAYSNFNYELLGLIVAGIEKRPFHDALSRLVLGPARMRFAGIEKDAATRQLLRKAGGRHLLSNAYYQGQLIDEEFAPAYLASGSAFATVSDMLALDTALGGTTLLSDQSKRRMVDEAVEIRPGYHQALAGLLRQVGADLVWYQWGAMDGFRPYFARVPSRGLAIVVLTNVHEIEPHAVGAKLLEGALGQPVTPNP